MQFETEEPTHGAFSSLSYAFENLVNMYSLVFADTQWCAVNEAYAVMSEKVCKILLVLSLMLGFPKHEGNL